MTQATRTGQNRQLAEAHAVLDPASLRAVPQPPDLTPRPPPRLTVLQSALPAEPAQSALAQLRTVLAPAAARETGRGLLFLFLPVAMGAGAGLHYAAARNPGLIALVCGLVISLVLVMLVSARHTGLARAAGFAAAIFAGAIAADIEQRAGALLLDQDVTTGMSGIVEAREFDATGRVRYLIRVLSTADPELGRPPGRVRLVARAQHPPLPVGAMISGRARLSAPSGPVMPGGYDFAFRAFIDGIGAHGFFYRAPETAGPSKAPLAEPQPPARLQAFRLGLRNVREKISARIRSVLPGDPGGIAAALAVSDRRGISQATVDALRATGLAHILAISGLHMALAAGTLYILIRKLLAVVPAVVEAWAIKKFAAIGALLAATAYLMISGGSVATQRAWVMLVIMLVAVLADRPALTMRNVALAAMAIILLTPSAVVGPGFQMSFAATAALISAYAALSARKTAERSAPPGLLAGSVAGRTAALIARAVLGLAITSLVAGLATGLFSAHHFHRLAGNGVLANVLAMPIVTFVVMPAGVLALLTMPFGLDAWPLTLMGKGLEGVIWAARTVQSLGGDIVVGQIPRVATMTAASGLVILVFLRSRLRLGGVVLIMIGGALTLPPLGGAGPDILVSEDGSLVGLAGTDGLATNATRPNAFVFRQWQTALRDKPHVPPVSQKQSSPGSRGSAKVEEAVILEELMSGAETTPSRFVCAGRGVCAAMHRGVRIIAINDAALIGAACDRADLVIVAIPVHMRTCRSGAILVTSRSLRTSGSLALRVGNKPQRSPMDPGQTGPNTKSHGGPNRSGRPELAITAALAGVVRPWTVQRYYDWRSRSYDLPR